MKKTTFEEQYEDLKRALAGLGFVRPGTLVRRYMPCGKSGCRCLGDPPHLHGPYFQWTRKVKGKTVTLRLTQEQARLCSEWVSNHRRLKAIVRKMEGLSLKETDRIIGSIS